MAAIRRGPLAVVWGLSGLGKSALVSQVLHTQFRTRVPKVVWVPIPKSATRHHAAFETLRAVAETHRLRDLDWRAVREDGALLAATVVELVDRIGAWVVLDDVHHGADDGRDAQTFLAAVAHYAKRSRWIATSQRALDMRDMVEQVIQLGAIRDDALAELARACAPDLDDTGVARAVTVAGGSPWRLRRAALAPERESGSESRRILSTAPDAVAELLVDLSVLEIPVAETFLRSLSPAYRRVDLAEFAQRGLLEHTGAGVRLSDVARSLIVEEASSAARLAALRRIAAAAEAAFRRDPTLVRMGLEAARLWAHAGDARRLASLLDTKGDAFIEAGHADTLASAIADVAAPEVSRWRICAAVELGDSAALEALSEPADENAPTALLWARALYRCGKTVEAVATAAKARRLAMRQRDTQSAFDAGLLEAHLRGVTGDPKRALAVLKQLRAPTAAARLTRASHLARWLHAVGQHRAALSRADAVRERSSDLAPSDRREVLERLAAVYTGLGRLARATEMAAAASDGSAGAQRGVALYRTRKSMVLRAALAIDNGRLADAVKALDPIRPIIGESPALSLYVEGLDVQRRTAAGDLAGLVAATQSLAANAERQRDAYVYTWARMYQVIADTLRAEPPAAAWDWPMDVPAQTGAEGLALDLRRARQAVRFGRNRGVRGLLRKAERSEAIDVRVLAGLVAAEFALLDGDTNRARARAKVARQLAETEGWRLLECETEETLATIALVSRESDALMQHTARLAELAAALPSERFRREASFLALAAANPATSPATLERLACLTDTSPVAARRARALLTASGAATLFDRLDALVVNACAHAMSGVTIGTIASRAHDTSATSPWRSGWGLDETRQCVWLPSGEIVDFARQNLMWNILTAIAENGGAISKEALVLRVWPMRDYHPLRDDTRMHVAIRRLRMFIEEDPDVPTRVVTTEAGYAFGTTEAVRRLLRRDKTTVPSTSQVTARRA